MEFEKSSLCRIMEIENFIEVDNLVFQKITEVGNLCRAGRTLEKNKTTPETPPHRGGNMLTRQQLGIGKSV